MMLPAAFILSMQRFVIPLLILLLSSWVLAHPADTSNDGAISAQELAIYAGTGPSADLLQQAQNVFQLGAQGAYSSESVGSSTVYVPSNAAYTFASLERYHSAPFSSVLVGALPQQNTNYIAYGSHPSNLARYFPISLWESVGGWTLTVPGFAQHFDAGTRINVFIHEEGMPLDDSQRLEVGQFSIAPVDVEAASGANQQFLDNIDSTIAKLEILTGIDYSDYFVNGQKVLSSVSDPFDQLEIGVVCYLQDPNLDGGLRSTLSLLNEFPEFAAEMNGALDFLASQGTGQVNGVMAQFRTQFTAFGATAKKGKPTKTLISDSPSAQELLDGMLDAAVAESMLMEPLFGPGAGAANTALGFAGLPGKIVSGSVGMTTAVLQFRYSRIAAQNPSSAKLKAMFSKTTFHQDECDVTGSWTAQADAKSKEWLVDKAAFDLLLGTVGVFDAASNTVKVANAFGKTGNVNKGLETLRDVESFNRVDVASAAGQFSERRRE